MAEYDDRDRFIPYCKSEIVEMICKDDSMVEGEREQFKEFCTILQSLYHFNFHEKVEFLKDNYFPFNPDKDTKTTREYTPNDLEKCEKDLVEKFNEVLNDANYESITEEDLKHAMEEESLFHVSLYVDFEDFASYLLYRRGEVVKKETVKKMFLFKKEIEVPTYERVAMLIKFKNEKYFKEKKRKIMFQPGTMLIKLFKDIPKADMEMLFPNTQVRMKLKDKLMMGIPALGGGIAVMLKTAAGLIAFASVLITMIASLKFQMPGKEQMPQIIGGLTALGVLGGFLFKQWTKFKNRKIQFMKMLGDNLYFKNLDNNVGVFHQLIDSAEEEECKEAILGYYFLLKAKDGLSEPDLDDAIEEWFEHKHATLIDFEVDDALRKLVELELCTIEEKDGTKIYKALTMNDACTRLDYIWDNFFQYNV